MQIPSYILAGGAATRFGSNKARALLSSNTTLIEYVAYQIESHGQWHRPIALARQHDAYSDLSIPTLGDIAPEKGPLGGLLTALRHAEDTCPEAAWVLLTSCDRILSTVGPLSRLTDSLSQASSQNMSAVVFRDSRLQPFPGLYATSLANELYNRVQRNHLSLQHLLRDIPVATIELARPEWIDINRPEDLERVLADNPSYQVTMEK